MLKERKGRKGSFADSQFHCDILALRLHLVIHDALLDEHPPCVLVPVYRENQKKKERTIAKKTERA